ncbi:PAS domain-containing sensor histidine kinase [Deinococcus budaensis]|uniref:histidine kinase n=1 Tax=Deinococcus budaensis TaxID=1665626 RepID=A0A7W8GE60_9DEIO|nr:ATP-binding protein [Deinococcus budaensis]MBB5233967.1 signal transduction histidine kinase [Deinococcus budaensis]
MTHTTDLPPFPDGPTSAASEMGLLVRDFDWAATPLGPRESWPGSLRTVTDLLLAHPFAMTLLWGQDLVQVYNDPYRLLMGAKHPAGLGQPTRECWPEVWPFNAPLYEAVMQRGEAAHFSDQPLTIQRHGHDEEAFFTLCYSPVRDESGEVGGVLVTVIETTERVRAQQQVQEGTRQLDAGARAQEALVTFTEAVGTQAGVWALIRQAIEVLRARFGDGSSLVYFEREGDRWRARVWTEDLEAQPELLGTLQAGLPLDTLLPAEAARTREPLFIDRWDTAQEEVPHSGPYRAAANTPLVVNGEVCGLIGLGLRHTHRWNERDRAVVRAVGRGLNLALERAEEARQWQAQNAELDARNRALGAFAELTRDLALETDPYRLIRRTQEVVLSLLPAGFSLYFEPGEDAGRWLLRSQVGEVSTPELQRAVQSLPFADTANLRIPWESGESHFQDAYDHAADQLSGSERYPGASATLPVSVGGRQRGVLGFALSREHRWTRADRAMLDTVRSSLNLALERVETTAALVAQRQSLEAANEELEAFTYSVSHDLRTPVRHVMGFNQLLRQHLGAGADARGERYLKVIEEAAGRMNTLIDAMLDLSRTSRQPLRLGPVELGELVEAVRWELEGEGPGRGVRWQIGPLPRVMADRDTLRQVLSNLLDNALKYTRPREAPQIELWAEGRPGEWAVFVRDNGVGFDPRYSNKLFGVFQRLHRAEDFEGTGVGLANVRRIVTRHGGRVWAEGLPGEGATFAFTLPRT